MSKLFDLNTTNLSHLSFLQKKKKISPFKFLLRIFLHVKVKCDGKINFNLLEGKLKPCGTVGWKDCTKELQGRGISYFLGIYVILL